MLLRGPLYLRVSGAVAPSALVQLRTKLSRVKMPESLPTSEHLCCGCEGPRQSRKGGVFMHQKRLIRRVDGVREISLRLFGLLLRLIGFLNRTGDLKRAWYQRDFAGIEAAFVFC